MAKLKPPVSEKDHMQGAPDAPVILVEYGDFQCPHCGAAYPIVKQLEQKFRGKMALVFRHFPLSEVHPYAQAAAVASEAAANQGKFWEMHALIFEFQSRLSPATLLHHAKTIQLNLERFEKDIQDPTLFDKVEADFESGIVSGVNGTPSFFINGVKYNGSYDYDSMSEAIGAVKSKA
jgi:protein-disulfide isomerase